MTLSVLCFLRYVCGVTDTAVCLLGDDVSCVMLAMMLCDVCCVMIAV